MNILSKIKPVYLILGIILISILLSSYPIRKESFQDLAPFEAILRVDDMYVNITEGIGECKRTLVLSDKPVKFYFAPVGNMNTQ